MMVAHWCAFDRVLDDDALVATHAAVRAVTHFEMFTAKAMSEGVAAGLVARHDAAREFLRTGGLSGRAVDLRNLADRVNFFRATLAYGIRVEQPGIEAYLGAPRLAEAAREAYGDAIVEPAMVFVNIALPGQEIGVHTDVPEFRGLDRDRVPEWLLVVMHHSGLFAEERVAIATGVSWFGQVRGGEFDGLELATVLTRLRRDLADRGRLPSAETELRDAELAVLMIDEYLRFPTITR